MPQDMWDDGDPEALDPPERRPKSRLDMWRDGELSVDDFDDDELWRGYPRNHDGRFGPGPQKMPLGKYRELRQRQRERGMDAMHGLVGEAVEVVAREMRDLDNPGAVRLAAAVTVLDRTVGKAAERVEMTVETAPWQKLQAAGIWRQLPAEQVEEAEVVE